MEPVIYRRSDRRSWPPGAFGGHCVGARVIGRHVVDHLTLCDCCCCWTWPGEVVLDVVRVDGIAATVCSDCGPPGPRP
jgi:hypothetical protein